MNWLWHPTPVMWITLAVVGGLVLLLKVMRNPLNYR